MIAVNDNERFSALQRAEIAEIAAVWYMRRREASVSVLFNEPKLLKSRSSLSTGRKSDVSVLFNEPKLLKSPTPTPTPAPDASVSVLFNEPKLLK